MKRWLILAILGGCGTDYELTITDPKPDAMITSTQVEGSAQGKNLGTGDAITATFDDVEIPGFHSGYSPGHCEICFFSIGFNVPAGTVGEHIIHLGVTKGTKELAGDDISLVFNVP